MVVNLSWVKLRWGLVLAVCVLLLANLFTGAVSPSQLGLTEPPQIPGQQWQVHDIDRPQPPRVVAAYNGEPVLPPADALILFDGSHLKHFQNQALMIDGEAMTIGPGGQETKRSFADMQLHLEWKSPKPVLHDGQNRGNSGILLMGRYEIQVLDSYNNPTYADGQAGALYGQWPPMVNASRAPGQWQSYDIIFKAPRFNKDQSLRSPAYVTVIHNGVVVQFNRAFYGPARWRDNSKYQYHPERLPLKLQWHRSDVQYRNIWLRELDSAAM